MYIFYQEACRHINIHIHSSRHINALTVLSCFFFKAVMDVHMTLLLFYVLRHKVHRLLSVHVVVVTDQQEHQASIGDNRETLVIEGFRFESAVSRENLRSPQAGTGGCQDDT